MGGCGRQSETSGRLIVMVVHFKTSALRQGQPSEYVARFALGGLATVMAGVIADLWGPAAGGVMLACPAIFCASATLIEKHERQRKAQKGLPGERRGKGAAALDAAGAGWGSIGLMAFAVVINMTLERSYGTSR